MERRMVIEPSQFLDGSPMRQNDRSVRELKLVNPETGFDDAQTLCLGLVEIDPGHDSPSHRHKCEEVYYVGKGSGEIEVDGLCHRFSPGSAVFNRPNTAHRLHNTGAETVQLVVVAGVMLVSLRPHWPTASPYEVFAGSSANEYTANEG